MLLSQEGVIDAQKLDRLAEIAVKVGLNLQQGQELVLTSPISSLPLVRRIVHHAYRQGASLVTSLFGDDVIALERFAHAPDESFDRAAGWLYEGIAKAFANGAARLAIAGDNPLLLAKEMPEKVSRLNRAVSMAYQPALEKITHFDINWSIVSYPNPDWAKVVFPDLSSEEATKKLAEAVFAASRVDREDALSAWHAHNENLHKRCEWLDKQNFAALHFKAGDYTNLKIGLADGHKWQGGASVAKNGVTCNANIPTEEVFTTPHAQRVEGYLRSTMPLCHNGTLIDGIEMLFEKGRVVKATAQKGQEVLQKLLETDEGAARLGEVALVPHSSPISKSGLLFYNTLFDENAACHIALGQCYAKCFEDRSLTEEQMMQRGGNKSFIHVDWMIGSGELNISGLKQDGSVVEVFHKGEWAFE